MKKLIIEVRANEYATREKNPNVPWTAEELGRDAAEVREAGASIYHFHARGSDGSPAHETKDYAAGIAAIRGGSDILVHPTLGQITVRDPAARASHIVEMSRDPRLRPDFCPIDTGSTNIDVFEGGSGRFQTGARTYVNTTETLLDFARTFRACGVRPVAVVWAVPFLRTAEALLEAGELDVPAYLLLLHSEGGLLGAHPGTPAGLNAYLDFLPRHPLEWSVCCEGGNLFQLAATAICSGGHIAIGIGDYAYPELGAPTNAVLVREVARLARLLGREVASPDEAKAMLGMR